MTLISSFHLFAQLSPGDLHQSHAHLEGLKNCTQCHQLGSNDFRDKCLDCHDLLANQIAEGKGLHASDSHSSCQTCHKDHHGRDFTLIHWGEGMEAFDHDLTGFSLEGQHKKARCRDCHKPQFIAELAQLERASKDPNRTFLGLSPACSSCHQDPHHDQFVDPCASCHVASDWKALDRFDHSNSRFPLKSKHADIACAECHRTASNGLDSYRLFRPVPHSACSDCHQDRHPGQFESDCRRCHDERGWQPATAFDHRHSRYPLTGLHRTIACGKCHPTLNTPNGSTMKFKPLPFSECSDCHRDPHTEKLGGSCSQCHDSSGWQAAASAFDHGLTSYPLSGRHKEVPCQECHTNGTLSPISGHDSCRSCHQDPHLEQFDPNLDCGSCHTVNGFSPSTYDEEDHQSSAYPLSGSHQAVPCLDCHREVWWPETARTARQFRFPEQTCTQCHPDPHRDAFENTPQTCQECHSPTVWHDVQFDHDLTFKLTGKHTNVACKACHQDQSNALVFSTGERSCAACHEDIHQSQFLRANESESQCARCHVTKDWFAEQFNHQTMASFHLDGSHLGVACEKCHFQDTTQQPSFTRYKPIKSDCSDCHTAEER